MRRSLRVKFFLLTSLLLNVLLAYVLVVTYTTYTESLNYYKLQIKNLTEEIENLKKEQEIIKNQLNYYRNQTLYYSSSLTGGVEGYSVIEGISEVNLVAVRIVEASVFGYKLDGTTLKGCIVLKHGSGDVLVSTEPKIGIDLQSSLRLAVHVAENVTLTRLTETDVILKVTAKEEVDIIDGPSAGAAITVAIIAAIKHEKLNSSVYVTGTINPDGSIGQVGGIPEKALAAAKEGCKLFLVPEGQDSVVVWRERERRTPIFTVIVREPYTIKLEEFLKMNGYSDVKVLEVENITQTYNLMRLQQG
ncbi:MAG: S16 family serine protease [Candidatus Bathyarchaeota archaeon]